jgi:hypothetical protein
MNDIRDIKGPLALSSESALALWLACAGLLLLGALALWWRKRQTSRPPGTGQDQSTGLALPAALDRLEREAASLSDREFAFRLAALARAALETRLSLPAAAMTAPEITTALAGLPQPSPLGRELARIFAWTEAVGYAGAGPGPGDREHGLATLRALLAPQRP